VNSFLQTLNRPVIALAAVALIAGGLRFNDLGHPPDYYFDEVYYAKDSCLYAGYDFRDCNLERDDEQTWVHPPLGKWMIAAGEKVFGNDPFGWRFASALFGTASVVLLAAIALILFRGTLWAFVAGLLLATEHLNFVQSRISMLDILLAFWVVLGFFFLVLDRRWIDRRTAAARVEGELAKAEDKPGADDLLEPLYSPGPGAMAVEEPLPASEADTFESSPSPPVPSPLWRPWRFAAGASFGAAAAVKWSGLFALIGAALLAAGWEWRRRRRADTRHPLWGAIREESFGLVLAFLLIPALVYMATYTGFFIDRGFSLQEFWNRQKGMYDFHAHLDTVNDEGEPSHPYLSRPLGWLILQRPVAYFFEGEGTEILGVGNPVVFWLSLVALPYLVYSWIWKRDWRVGVPIVGVASQYLPWIAWSRPEFLFYMTPVTPFLILAVTYFVRDLSEVRLAGSRSRPFLPVAVGCVVLAVAVFAFFWPVLTAYPLSKAAWNARIWLPSWV
jgi:dolichyl-phosphate-mannose-protein mannosyltransferase